MIISVQKSKLEGVVHLSGAKNSVLRLLAASILSEGKIKIHNYPSGLLDAKIHVDMLNKLGKSVHQPDNETLIIDELEPIKSILLWEKRSIRNTLLILGALTTRTGEGSVPLPGGCKLGDRKYDLHVMLLKKLGAEVWEENEMLCARAPIGGFQGTDIQLPIRSTGATENAILCGTLANGITRIWNPHIRPEILDLVEFLNKMGAKISVYGQEHIEIKGVSGLNGVTHSVIPDNMEAITWLAGSVMTHGDIEIRGFPFEALEVTMAHLRSSGAECFRFEDRLIVRGGKCYPIEISTGPHPGINSDIQPILAAYAAQANGISKIVDLRFPGRYGYAEEMKKLGLDYKIEGNLLNIFGKNGGLMGNKVRALDLRAGAALLLSGLTAEGETIIEDAWQIERGYNNIFDKLSNLGAKVEVLR
ncbi:UDP-N-acetylglucosamine 1-carboxyvinyltransferase [Balneolaceae bacterium ANBcel3]|nr:UDP-N-acetylglucosamine 1-carboxyvinyltransferase [Balneolaceae bacterium ANBcel3]